MAAGDLTTLANAKEWLELDSSLTSDDALLARLISAASGFIRIWCNRDFVRQPYVETRSGNGGRSIVLAQWPIVSVESLVIDGQPVPPAPANGAGYLISRSMVMLVGYFFARGAANIQISYTAGYATIPPEIEDACIQLVGFRYRERSRIGKSSESMGGETTAYQVRDVPAGVRTILDQYKMVVPA